MGKSHSNASTSSPDLLLRLNSPVGAEPHYFPFPGESRSSSQEGGSSVGLEIVETIRWVSEDLTALKKALDVNEVLVSYDLNCYDSMKKLCHKYNQSIEEILKLEKGTSTLQHRLQQRPSRGLLKHIIQKIYNSSVTEPEKLNIYEPFSPAVYGETSYDLVCKILDQVDLNEDDVFIDLGSGVGQVVLQIAGLTKCKSCLGIEKAEVPSSYAIAMDSNFKKWMRWFGKVHSEYSLVKGDFLEPANRELITSSSIVFVNNYAFGPIVDHELKERFADLKDGARIVSSRSFCPLQFRITERTLGDIGAIIHIEELVSTHGNVSWTNKPVSYWCHTVDRSKLQRYFETIKKKKKADSSSNEENNGENVGPTTRRAWSDWCSKSGDVNTEEEEEEDEVKTKRKKPSRGKPARRLRRKNKRRKPIVGLDLLHQSTLESTNQANTTPAPGTVDQKLTQLTSISTTGLFHHEELIPACKDTPYALQKLLELYRKQMLGIIEGMKSQEFRQQVQDQIELEKQRRVYLLNRVEVLNSSINKLIIDSTKFLKLKLEELNIASEHATADTLLSEARSIVIKHKEIQSQAEVLQMEVYELEKKNSELVQKRKLEIVAGLKLDPKSVDEYCHKYLLKELVSTLDERKRLQKEATYYEGEVGKLEDSVREGEKRKKRMSRMREWPEIPSLEIINEKNPELLAKRILETGRLVEGQQQQQQTNGGNNKRKLPTNNNQQQISYPGQQQNNYGSQQSAAPRVNYLEDRLQELITNCLKEDSQETKPPIVENNKKVIPSPDIASGPAAGAAKNALRAHLSKSTINEKQIEIRQNSEKQGEFKQQGGSKRTIGDVVSNEVDRCMSERRPSVLVAGPGMEGLGAVMQMQYGHGHGQQQQNQNTKQNTGQFNVTEVVLGPEQDSVNSVLRVVRKRVEETTPNQPAAAAVLSTTAITRVPTPVSRAPTPQTPTTTTNTAPTPPPLRHPSASDSPHQWQTKISQNFDKLFCLATEARRKSTEAKQDKKDNQIKSSGSDGESPDSGLGKELTQNNSSMDEGLPRTPSPSHVDEDEELCFGGGYKEWVVEDEGPPPTPRLLQVGSNHNKGEEIREEGVKEQEEKVALVVKEEVKSEEMEVEETKPTNIEEATEHQLNNTQEQPQVLERPPSTASSTCSAEQQQRPSSAASSSAAGGVNESHTTNTNPAVGASQQPQHFKKRWNQSQQQNIMVEVTPQQMDSTNAANPVTPADEPNNSNRFRPKGKIYMNREREEESDSSHQQGQSNQQQQITTIQPAQTQQPQQVQSILEQKWGPPTPNQQLKPQLKNIVNGSPVYNKVSGSVTAGGGQQQQQQHYGGHYSGPAVQQQHYGAPPVQQHGQPHYNQAYYQQQPVQSIQAPATRYQYQPPQVQQQGQGQVYHPPVQVQVQQQGGYQQQFLQQKMHHYNQSEVGPPIQQQQQRYQQPNNRMYNNFGGQAQPNRSGGGGYQYNRYGSRYGYYPPGAGPGQPHHQNQSQNQRR